MTKAQKSNEVKTEAPVIQAVPTTIQPINMDEAVKEHGSISGVIRYLAAQGHKRGPIAKMTGKRYQHVRNVLVTPVKKVEG